MTKRSFTLKAALLLSGAALAAPALGVGSAAAAVSCGSQTAVQPFLRWSDSSSYVPLPGGSFESGPAWTLSGGAQVAAGNESFFVNSTADTHSLSLPTGSSATSAPICVTLDSPTMRFLAVNTGSRVSLLKIEAITTVLGKQVTLPIGLLASNGTWQPGPQLFVILNLIAPVSGNLSFRFTPVGSGGAWRIDDVYLDPTKHRTPGKR